MCLSRLHGSRAVSTVNNYNGGGGGGGDMVKRRVEYFPHASAKKSVLGNIHILLFLSRLPQRKQKYVNLLTTRELIKQNLQNLTYLLPLPLVHQLNHFVPQRNQGKPTRQINNSKTSKKVNASFYPTLITKNVFTLQSIEFPESFGQNQNLYVKVERPLTPLLCNSLK